MNYLAVDRLFDIAYHLGLKDCFHGFLQEEVCSSDGVKTNGFHASISVILRESEFHGITRQEEKRSFGDVSTSAEENTISEANECNNVILR